MRTFSPAFSGVTTVPTGATCLCVHRVHIGPHTEEKPEAGGTGCCDSKQLRGVCVCEGGSSAPACTTCLPHRKCVMCARRLAVLPGQSTFTQHGLQQVKGMKVTLSLCFVERRRYGSTRSPDKLAQVVTRELIGSHRILATRCREIRCIVNFIAKNLCVFLVFASLAPSSLLIMSYISVSMRFLSQVLTCISYILLL